jgi:hypothetical protein
MRSPGKAEGRTRDQTASQPHSIGAVQFPGRASLTRATPAHIGELDPDHAGPPGKA